MPTLETAIRIAVSAHAGQLDKSGEPYITHPLRLMNAVDDADAKIVAVLHDVVEDTATSMADLCKEGFSQRVLDALALVTHDKTTPYADYVIAIKTNPIARAVKLADLTDNTRLDRCLLRPEQIDRDFARLRRYLLSYRFLTDRMSEADYVQLMQRYGELD